MKLSKIIGLAGIVGVVGATGAVIIHRRRAWVEVEPDEIRARLHERLAASAAFDD